MMPTDPRPSKLRPDRSGLGATTAFASRGDRFGNESSGPRPRAAQSGGVKKWLVVALVLIVVLVAAVGIGGPIVAAGIARTAIADAVNQSIQGTVQVDRVNAGWGGPVGATGVVLRDPAGAEVARVSLNTNRGVLGLAMGAISGGLDLGTITVAGEAVLERGADGQLTLLRAIEARPSAATAPPPRPTGAPTPGGQPAPASPPAAPPGLRGTLDLAGIEVSIREGGRAVAGIRDLRGGGALVVGQPINLSFRATPMTSSSPITVALTADNLFDGAGTLTPERLEAVVKLDASFDDAEINAGVRALTGAGAVSSASGPGQTAARIALRLAGGRLTLHEGVPTTIAGAIPPALAAAATGAAEGALELNPGARASLTIDRLDLPTQGLAADWRNAALDATLALEGIAGRFALPSEDGGAGGTGGGVGGATAAGVWQAFALDTAPARVVLDPGTARLTINAGANGTIDGQPAGTLSLDAEVAEALDANGVLATSLPGVLRGALELDGVRTDAPWFGLIERLSGAPLAAALGERATLRVNASLPPAELRTDTVEVLASLELDAPRTTAGIGFAVSTTGVRAHNGGVLIETSAAEPVLRALGVPLTDPAYRLELAAARASVRMPAFFVPIVDRGPDLGGARGELAIELRDARGVLVEKNLPVALQLLRLTTALTPDQPARADLVGTMTADGAPLNLSGFVRLKRPAALTGAAAPLAALGEAGLTSELRIEGIPSRLASLADPALAEQLDAAMGERFMVSLESSEWKPAPGAADAAGAAGADGLSGLITLVAEGPRGRLRGAADLGVAGATSIKTRGDGFQLVLQEPQRLIDTLGLEGVELRAGAPFVAYLVDVDASLPGASADPAAGAPTPEVRTARIEVRLPRLVARVAPVEPATGQPSTITLVDPRFDATLNADGWADLALLGTGDVDGTPLRLDGSIGIRGALARALDPAGFVASAKPLETRGTWTASGLSASAARVVDPALAGLIDAALPGPIRMEVAASRTGPSGVGGEQAEAPGFLIRTLGAGDRPIAATRLGIDGSRLIAGPTLADLAITPDLVRRGLDFAKIDASTAPSLVTPFELSARVSGLRFPLDGPGVDPLRPEGAYEATLTTGPGDVVFRVPESAGAAAGGTSIGVRGLTAFRRFDPANAAQSRQGARVQFVDPQAGNASLGIVDATASLDDLSAISVVGQDLRLDQIAARFGLGEAPALALGAGPARLNLTGGLPGGGANAPAGSRAEFTISLAAPRLTLDGTAGYDPASGALAIAQPMRLAWNLDRRLMDQFVLGTAPGTTPAIRLSGDVQVNGAVDALDLVLPEAASGRPLRINALAAGLTTSPITLLPQQGAATELGPLRVDLRSEPQQPGTIGLVVRSGAGAGGSGSGEGPITAEGRIRLPEGGTGGVPARPGIATLSARGALPTAAIDAIARSGQTLTALLGDRASFTLSVDQMASDLSSGGLRAAMDSPNAIVRVRGAASNGALQISTVAGSADEITEARLTTITPEASRILFRPLFPIFSNIQKSSTERPTLLSVDRLSLPADGDIAGVSGVLTLDLGEVSFATPEIVGSILSATGGRGAGTIGTRLAPIVVTIDKGVASYEPWAIPIGEFTLHLSGRVDLKAQRVEEMLLYVPIGALVGEVSSQFTRIPVLGRISTAAFRLSGPVDDLKIAPVLDPAQLLGMQGIGGGNGEGADGDPIRGLIREGLREGLRESGRVDDNTANAIDGILRGIGRPRREEPKKDEPQPEPPKPE